MRSAAPDRLGTSVQGWKQGPPHDRKEPLMTAASPETPGLVRDEPSELKLGSAVMVIGAVAFIAYAVWFFIRNFTGQFLEVGIGPEQVDVGRDQILAFSPQLYDYISHLHI